MGLRCIAENFDEAAVLTEHAFVRRRPARRAVAPRFERLLGVEELRLLTARQFVLADDLIRQIRARGLPSPSISVGDENALTLTWQLPSLTVCVELLRDDEIEWWSNLHPDGEYEFERHYEDDNAKVTGEVVQRDVVEKIEARLRLG